jgi:hypothetical protein
MEPSITEPKTWGLQYFLTALLILLLLITGSTAAASIILDISFFQLIGVWQVIGSIVLSAILAFLYIQMRDIQSEQKDIMFQQQSPLIFIDSVSFNKNPMHEDTAERISKSSLPTEIDDESDYFSDKISVKLENQGNGVATDIRVHSEINYEVDDQAKTITALRRPLTIEGREGMIGFGRKKVSIMGNWSNHLEERSENKFDSPLIYSITDSGREDPINIPFGVVTELLAEQEVEEASISFKLVYEDSLDYSYRENIIETGFDIESNMELVEALSQGEREISEEHKQKMIPEDTVSASELS